MILIYLSLGILSGFFSSTPLGPINFWVTNHKLSNSPKVHLIFFLTAVILVDIIYAGIAMWGQFDLLVDSDEVRWTGIVSGIFTVLVGFFIVKNASLVAKDNENRFTLDSLKSFIQGLALTGANPAFILFWLFVANQIIFHLNKTISHYELGAFLLGVVVGDILWFIFFGWILSHLERKSQASTLRHIRLAVGIIFILLGFIATGSYVFR